MKYRLSGRRQTREVRRRASLLLMRREHLLRQNAAQGRHQKMRQYVLLGRGRIHRYGDSHVVELQMAEPARVVVVMLCAVATAMVMVVMMYCIARLLLYMHDARRTAGVAAVVNSVVARPRHQEEQTHHQGYYVRCNMFHYLKDIVRLRALIFLVVLRVH